MSNNPPDDADPLIERLKVDHAKITARIAELADGFTRVPETATNETMDQFTGFAKQLKTLRVEIERAREAEKRDFLEAGRKVQTYFKEQDTRVELLLDAVLDRISAYQKAVAEAERKRRMEEAAEAQRLADEAAAEAKRQRDAAIERQRQLDIEAAAERERLAEIERQRIAALPPQVDPALAIAEQRRQAQIEADRQAAEDAAADAQREEDFEAATQASVAAREAEAKAEAAKAAVAAPVAKFKGAYGGSVSTKTVTDFTVLDKTKAAASLAAFISDDAVEKAGRAYLRLNKIREGEQPIPGVRFFERSETKVS